MSAIRTTLMLAATGVILLAVSAASAQFAATPLCDMAPNARYLGQFQGGLYLSGSNTMPADHSAEGMARRALIRPLDTQGQPSANGRFIMLSIGMSNTRIEFAPFQELAVPGWTQLNNNHSCAVKDSFVLYNGARASQTAEHWVDTTVSPNPQNPMGGQNNWVRLRNELVDTSRTEGLTLSKWQVQVGWMKVTNITTNNPLSSGAPRTEKDAYHLLAEMGSILRTFKSEYPNVKMVFLTSRIYSYSNIGLSPEPYPYENGFAVKWLIEAQIRQMRGETSQWDDLVGDLRYRVNGQDGPVPWIAWGPYMWASGTTPRSDGLTWSREEFENDGVHPNASGCDKVANLMMNYFNSSPFAEGWFRLAPAVAATHIFCNNSVYDGNNAAANAADDAAICPGKQPLMPGQSASGANITSYGKGINGVMVDLANAADAAAVNASDFLLQTSINGSNWTTAPSPGVSVRLGAGVDGSDRVTLTWPDNMVKNTWLRVQVQATGRTGLAEPGVMYWGNLVGNATADGNINVFDLLKVQQNYMKPAGDSSRDGAADVTGDGNVNVFDLLLVRQNYLRSLALIQAP